MNIERTSLHQNQYSISYEVIERERKNHPNIFRIISSKNNSISDCFLRCTISYEGSSYAGEIRLTNPFQSIKEIPAEMKTTALQRATWQLQRSKREKELQQTLHTIF